MAVLGRLLVSSAERLDLPDLLSIDSYAAGDWKYFLKGFVGNDKPYILKGFDVIDPLNAVGTQSCSIRVADSIAYYPSSDAGSFFHGLEEGNVNAAPLVPELRKNAVNYVYLTFSTFDTSADTRAFWDPDKDGGAGGEFSQDVNTESVLKVEVNVSTGSFPTNTVPVAIVTVGPVVITKIEDARHLLCRLGSGGINPDPFNTYNWRSLPSSTYARQEPPTEMSAGGINPFQGADKNITSVKEWMDAVMSKLRELGGTTYWYEDASTFSVISGFVDAAATAFKSKGKWVHDTVTVGLLTWTEDIHIKSTADPRTYIIRQGSKQLDDEQVMYIVKQRNLLLNSTDESVSWVNSQVYVNTVGGAVGLFENLSKGDYIKKINDSADKWVRVEEFYDAVNLGGSTTTAANARSVRLGSAYLGTTGEEKGRYDKGIYLAADVQVSDRSDTDVSDSGGDFHWLAIRSDTIQSIGSITRQTLSAAIDQHDGTTARVTMLGHNLIDGDRITITNTTNFNGTYTVEVESSSIFYISISGGPFADETGDAHRATVVTTARSTPYGVQEESANHGFNSNDTIIISDTVNYNNSYLINVHNATTFNIPVPGSTASESSGLATLGRVIVRTEGMVADLIQGQVIDIGGSIADNMRQYIGMASLSETAPSYFVPVSYNTLDGMANYNATANESLTARVSKLTAMMSDKAQDKTVKYLPTNGMTTISNTTNGLAQELRFLPNGSSMTLMTPSSDGQAFVALPGATPLSLLENQAAYVSIDRNSPTTPSIQVADISSVPLSENVFVLAARLNTQDLFIWDGSIVVVGSQPAPGYMNTVVRQNQMLKMIGGGNWAWNGTTLSWDATANIQVPGLVDSVNAISAGSVGLSSGQVAYVDINRVGPGGSLTVSVASNASLALTTDRFIIARNVSGNIIVGTNSMLLVSGESKPLYAGASWETLGALGLATEADKGMLRILQTKDGASKRIIITPIDTVVHDGTIWGNEISGLRMKFTGIQLDLETGSYYGYGDGSLAGSGSLIGSAFTPTSFTSPNLYRWYSINLVADALDTDGTITVKPLILAGTDGASSSTATAAPFSNKKIGQVLVQATGTGSTINNVLQSNVVQLAAGAGSGGSGSSPKMIGGGTFSWNSATSQLSFTDHIYIEQPRLNYSDNRINVSNSPLTLSTTNHVAYIDRLNPSSGGSDLVVNVDLITNVKDGQVIIARRDGSDVIVGSTSNRLRDGESCKLFAARSNFTNQDVNAKLVRGGVWSWGFNGTAEVQLITFSNVPQYGTWQLQYGQNVTSTLAYDASASQIEAALQVFPGFSGVTVSGNYSIGFTVTFGGTLAGKNVSQLSVVNDSLVYYTNGSTSLIYNNSLYTPANAENFQGETYTKLAQKFTVTQASKINYFDITAARTSSTPGGTVTGSLVYDNGGQPTGATIESVVIPTSNFLVGMLSAITFTMTVKPVLQPGDYWYIVDFSAVTGLNFPFSHYIQVSAMNVNDGTGKKWNSSTLQWDNDFTWTKTVQATAQVSNAVIPSESTTTQGSPSNQLETTASAFIQVPGLNENRNTIPAGVVATLPSDGDVAYVNINRTTGASANLSVQVAQASALSPSDDTFILARRVGSDVLVGKQSMRLLSLQSQSLDQTMSDQNLTYTGATSTADSTPSYLDIPNDLASFTFYDGDPLVTAVGTNTANINEILETLDNPSYDESITIVSGAPGPNELTGPVTTGTLVTIPVNSRLSGSPQQNYIVGKGTLEVFLNGQYLVLDDTNGWSEVGSSGDSSSQIEINQQLEVGDVITFRLDATGGPGSGGSSGAPDDDFVTLPISGSPDNNDLILIYDDSANAYRGQTRATFLSGLGNLKNVNLYNSNTTADANNDDVLLVNASSGSVTISLPSAVSASGKVFDIKKVDSSGNSVVIAADGADTIDGNSSISTTTQYESFTVVSDGSDWWIL